MKTTHVKRGDEVVVIAGTEKGNGAARSSGHHRQAARHC
jgi:ribosomal protein L24